jgi:inner membrane transporter RhtA
MLMPSLALSLLYLLIAMLSIQSGAALAKQLFMEAGPAGTTTLRVGFAALILLVMWRPWRTRFARAHLKDIALYGMSLGLMNLTFYLALERIPLGIAVALEFTGPLALSLMSSKRVTDILWAFLAGLGIYLIMPVQSSEPALDLVGIMFALVAGAFWALYIWFGQRAGKDAHSGHVTALGMTAAALVTLPFGVAINGASLVNISLWPLGLGIAVLSSAVPYSLEMLALKTIPLKTFGILMSAEPAFAALMGYVFLKEHLTGTQMIAVLCVMAASAGSTAMTRTK